MAGVMTSGVMIGARLVGTKVGMKLVSTLQVHALWEAFGRGAVISPKRFEWAKMNLETGAAVNTSTQSLGPDGAEYGRFYRAASSLAVFSAAT